MKGDLERHFEGPVIRRGSVVEHHAISAKDQSRLHQLGKKFYLEYSWDMHYMRVEIWKGDILVAQTLRSWKIFDVSEIHARRFNAKKVITPKNGEHFSISYRRWHSKIIWKTPWNPKTHCNAEPTCKKRRSEELCGDIQGSSAKSQPTDETKADAEARNNFWSIEGTTIIVIMFHLEFSSTCRKKKQFPNPLKYIDVTRTTYTNLDVLQEKRIYDYWNVDANRSLSDSWKGFTKFTLLKENLQRDICGPWGD